MEHIDKVLMALDVVERYEDYLFQRAWGKALMIIGTILPLGVFININIQILALSTGLEPTLLLFIANILTVLLCFGLVASIFYGAWQTASKHPDQEKDDSKHGPMIAITWFVCFVLTSFAPEPFRVLSLLWASSAACLLSFLILKFTEPHTQQQVILYLGIMLGLISLPLLIITDIVLSEYLTLIAFSICFIVAGLMMHQLANRTLQASS